MKGDNICMEKISSKPIDVLSITAKSKIKILPNEWDHSLKISKSRKCISFLKRLRRHTTKTKVCHKKSMSGKYYEIIFNFELPLSSNVRSVYSIQARAQRSYKQCKLSEGITKYEI